MSRPEGSSRGGAETRRGDWDRITGAVIDEAIKLHRDLGPRWLESVFEAILEKM
ncbi:MAG: hypothetical protein KatS3mg111_3279 [Pirellulaceae bacterium]|nr:MAG: hypothetical protein KatS3mg111_3279 [Pirellulaceae bacterium]